jgi:hypothetical protein
MLSRDEKNTFAFVLVGEKSSAWIGNFVLVLGAMVRVLVIERDLSRTENVLADK